MKMKLIIVSILSLSLFSLSGCTQKTESSKKEAPVQAEEKGNSTQASQKIVEIERFVEYPSGLNHYKFGKKAKAEEIKGWNVDVRPDGQGLPKGSGSVAAGEELYDAQCSFCHGAFGEGEGRWPALAGGMGTLNTDEPHKTVGSYWPYASTLFDYINRSMPYFNPKTLTADQTYAITAYVLYLNEIVDEDFVLSKENFSTIKMPNEANFYPTEEEFLQSDKKLTSLDARPDVHAKRCMKDCIKGENKIIYPVQGVTPDQE